MCVQSGTCVACRLTRCVHYRCPPPLRAYAQIDLEDHRSEVFVPPPYVAFGGAGASLGGGVGGGGRAAATAGAVVRPGAAPPAAAVDPALPVTTLQVKLLDGRKERLQFNLGHTVADLQARVLRCAAAYSAGPKSSDPPPPTDALQSWREQWPRLYPCSGVPPCSPQRPRCDYRGCGTQGRIGYAAAGPCWAVGGSGGRHAASSQLRKSPT